MQKAKFVARNNHTSDGLAQENSFKLFHHLTWIILFATFNILAIIYRVLITSKHEAFPLIILYVCMYVVIYFVQDSGVNFYSRIKSPNIGYCSNYIMIFTTK